MCADWETEPLEQLIEANRAISYGIVQPGEPITNGVPIIRVSDVRNGRIATSTPLRVSEAIESAYSRTRLKGGELLLTLVGTVGESAVVPDSLAGWNTARAVAVIPVRKEVGAYWVRTALSSPMVKEIIHSRLNTTVQATLNLGDVAQLPIVMPPVGERRAIAHILGTLDDKIELNRRMNETLEAMARALFQSWFVDFAPVHRNIQRAQGHTPPNPHLAEFDALFPDAFEDSTLGEIPKGWRVQAADALFEIGIGKTPPRKEHQWFSTNASDIPWISIRDMGNCGVFIAQTNEFLTPEAVEKFRVKRIPDGTVVLSFKLTVGRVAITDGEMLSNEAIAHFRPRAGVGLSSAFLYCYLGQFRFASLGSTSSIATAVNSDSIRAIPLLVPVTVVAEEFHRVTAPIFARMKLLQRKTATLAALRDTLLPKLISGELRVKDAERFMEGWYELATFSGRKRS